MKLTLNSVFILFTMAAGLLGGVMSSAYAGDRPNLLIMGEDADEDTVPRDSRVFKRVLSALTNQMHAIGFDVYDETVVTSEHFIQSRIRRERQELVDIGQSVRQPPIDVVVSFSVYASMLDKAYTHKVKVRIEGQMVQVNSGKFLGNFEVKSPKAWTAPADCHRECVLEVVGGYSKILANDLGAVLAEKLAFLVDGALVTDYNLIFDNFSADDMLDIEEYLVVFSDYKAHRPTYTSARRSELWYQSGIKSAKLQRNLNKMLARLDLSALITYSGNTFTIEQTVIKTNKKPMLSDQW